MTISPDWVRYTATPRPSGAPSACSKSLLLTMPSASVPLEEAMTLP